MDHDIAARTRLAIAELDAAADRVQALFDDASAEAYATSADPYALSCRASDRVDYLYEAAAAAHTTTARLRAALSA